MRRASAWEQGPITAPERRARVLGVILARGGSKGVPRKNARLVNGHPLVAYTIVEAKRCPLIDRVIVSSDDDEIRRIAVQYGAEAPFVRPAELASDTARSVDCDKHAVEWAERDEGSRYDFVVDLPCTNPLRTSDDITGALGKIIETGADSVIGVSRLDDHHPIRIKKIVNDRIRDFCLPEIPETRRQDLKPDAYIRNGSIYAARRDLIVKGIRYGTENSRPYVLPPERSVNVDSEIDLLLVELLLKRYPREYVTPVRTGKGIEAMPGAVS